MKYLLNIIIASCCLSANAVFGQITNVKAENLGLISELVFVKLTSENYAIRTVNDTSISNLDKIRFVNLYNDTKVISDQIIVQLISDCKRRNSIKYFKKLDALFLSKTITQISESDFKNPKLKGYCNNLKKMNSVYSRLIAFKTSSKPTKNLLNNLSLNGFFVEKASVEEGIGVLSFITSAIKDIKESKEKKVEKLTSILNELRLVSLQDLAKGEKKEGENEKVESK